MESATLVTGTCDNPSFRMSSSANSFFFSLCFAFAFDRNYYGICRLL
jgi:hypothetical protein